MNAKTIEWTKDGIMRWMHMHDIHGNKTHSEQQVFYNAFVDAANKHQATSTDRKLYRRGLKIIEATRDNKERAMQKLMEI